MPWKLPMDRRGFLRMSTTGAAGMSLAGAAEVLPQAPAANDRINVGFIGFGARAIGHMQAIQSCTGVEVTAVCDAYSGRVQRCKEMTAGRVVEYRDYQEIINRPDIDAVIVSTPDHLHKTQVIDALRAGKDVYCEKPMTYTIAEGLEIVKAEQASGRILMVGSQGMSSSIQRKAKELIKAGRLGRITMIRASYNRNTASGAWIYPIPPDASEKTVNWDMFLGTAPNRSFDLARFFRWRCYNDYSGGIATDLFVHLCTTIHFLMDADAPSRVVGCGQLYRWKESRDVPDTLDGILEYPGGFTVTLGSTFNNALTAEGAFQILGTEGSLLIGGDSLTFVADQSVEDNGWIVASWPKELRDAYYRDPVIQKAERPGTWPAASHCLREEYASVGPDETLMHFQVFFDALRTRKKPYQDALRGHRAAACAHMINRSVREERSVYWDPKTERDRI